MAPLTVCVAATPPPSPTRSRPTPPPWVSLPCEVTSLILQKLGTVEILRNARRVCTTWFNICKDPAMFRIIDIDEHYDIYEIQKLCRYAVDLSQGQLVDIKYQRPTDIKMIHYIAKQSPKLRCLRITLHSGNLSEAVKNLPYLEEMHLNYYELFEFQTTREISSWCPLLTSLSLIAEFDWDKYYLNSDQLAFGVSKMSQLRHLRIIGSKMTNVGLTAILVGCWQLESLELRKCPYLELDSELGERCRRQIKHLKLPRDFAEDFELSDEGGYEWNENSAWMGEANDYEDYKLREEGAGVGDNQGGEGEGEGEGEGAGDNEEGGGGGEGAGDNEEGEGDGGEGEGGYESSEDYNNIEKKWRRNTDERIESMTANIASLTASIDGTNAKLDYLITLHQEIRDPPQQT